MFGKSCKRVLVLAACTGVIATSAVATASAQKDKTHGSFGTSCSWRCWGNGDLVDLYGSNVWCAWHGEHVTVHLTLRNDSDHRLVATIKTSYWIRGHGRHGSSLHSLKHIEIDGNSTISWTGDAGKPQDVTTGAQIEACRPSLYAIGGPNPVRLHAPAALCSDGVVSRRYHRRRHR